MATVGYAASGSRWVAIRRQVGAWPGATAKRAKAIASKLRNPVLTIGAFACFTASAWTISLALGLAVAGVSLLVINWLMGGGER